MIKLERLREITSAQGNLPCMISGEKVYTWQETLSLTESKICFLKNNFQPWQLQSASFISKNSFELICWLSAFSTLSIPINGLDYSLPLNTLVNLLKKIKPGLLLISFKLYNADEISKLQSTGVTLMAIDAPIDPVVKSLGIIHQDKINEILKIHKPVAFRSLSLTSGTSSEPKIAVRYKSFDARRFAWFTARYGFNHLDGFMLILPLYHAAGNGWARMFMGLGSILYLVDQNNDQEIIKTLSSSHVSTSVMTPNLVSHLVEMMNVFGIKTHLRWLLVGGCNFSAQRKIEAVDALGAIIHEYYGCTESGINILAEPDDLISNPESVGRAFDGNKVIILDPKNNPVEKGIQGRVAIASYMLMDEYGDGRKPFVEIEGSSYFLMADYGYIDSQNRLFLMNRNADNKNTFHVYSIEEKLRSLPCINDIVIIPVIDNTSCSLECLYTTKNTALLKTGSLINKIENIFHEHKVSKFKIKNVESIPYSPSGKVRFYEVIHRPDAA
ncbi:class I adenylate-forming enzyme family protein [Erwinia sp. E_sp_B04_7]|uniref:class I adenylate-forming enzyme family protein n=1 Tax=unclassified Erwinia TaxID=2622719 RepID=UPI0030CFC0AD